MGFFTFWLFVVGSVQAGLFFWQLYLIRRSLLDTREAAKASTLAARASVKAANAAAKQAKIADDFAHQTGKTVYFCVRCNSNNC